MAKRKKGGAVGSAQSARVHLNQLFAYHQRQLADAAFKKEVASTKAEKNKWSAKVRENKSALRRLSDLYGKSN